MKTITIQVDNNKTMRLIEDLADLDLLKIIINEEAKVKSKLSARLSGSISKKSAKKLNAELKQSRIEWNRTF